MPMLALSSTSKYELYLLSTDMRKSFDSLSGIVLQELQSKPTDGVAYLFLINSETKSRSYNGVQEVLCFTTSV